jgi:hypothetical protein
MPFPSRSASIQEEGFVPGFVLSFLSSCTSRLLTQSAWSNFRETVRKASGAFIHGRGGYYLRVILMNVVLT